MPHFTDVFYDNGDSANAISLVGVTRLSKFVIIKHFSFESLNMFLNFLSLVSAYFSTRFMLRPDTRAEGDVFHRTLAFDRW